MKFIWLLETYLVLLSSAGMYQPALAHHLLYDRDKSHLDFYNYYVENNAPGINGPCMAGGDFNFIFDVLRNASLHGVSTCDVCVNFRGLSICRGSHE